MTQKLLTLPFRIGLGAARTAVHISAKTLDMSAKLAGTAIGTLWPGSSSEPDRQPATGPSATGPSATAPSTSTAPTQRPSRPRATRENRVNGHQAQSTAPPPPAHTPSESALPEPAPSASTAGDQPPPTPLSPYRDALKTIEDDDEIVAEFAEPGAEDGAGAQLQVAEPWEGYARMNAASILARVDQAGPAELALLELYEQTHKKRQTVLRAAAKRLRALSPPHGG
jgi:hypothetical protein